MIITLLVRGGLRRAALVALTLEDWVNAPPHPHVRVRAGKGRKERAVPIGGTALAAVERWRAVRGRAPGALFVRFIDRHGHLGPPGRHLTPQTVDDTARDDRRPLATLAEAARLLDEPATTDDEGPGETTGR